ncbi:MAG: DUF3365 domain-containing protein [Planctomycetes bacterium]|nr:DUF3365 domain-containing protein [Planctomycetota bacterium]
MRHPTTLLRALPAALALVLAGCGDSPSPPAPRDAAPIDPVARRETARALVRELATSLQGRLQQALAEGGPARAIEVCATEAMPLTTAVTRDGYSVRRIGTRVRNRAHNTPTAAERAILDEFATLPPEARATAFREVERDGRYAFYAPIVIPAALCLQCHGPTDELPPAVRAALAERYPDDEATGYALGDLRGAFVVEH